MSAASTLSKTYAARLMQALRELPEFGPTQRNVLQRLRDLVSAHAASGVLHAYTGLFEPHASPGSAERYRRSESVL
jgi:hypothetical protein